MSTTALLILNWNGGDDTITCLSSLLPNLSENDYVFIIDNGSTDNSIGDIKAFFHTSDLALTVVLAENLIQQFKTETKHYLVQNTVNLGFGAGNNTVLKRLASLTEKFEFAWLLNNDAVVEPRSLKSLQSTLTRNPGAGAAGSLIMNYPDDKRIQCSGVQYYKFFGASRLVNKYKPVEELDKTAAIPFDYLNGASLLLRLSALEKTGYFDERFFLYSEELDLELRLQEHHFELKLDLDSVVYHKLGGGTNRKKYLFYYYYNTSAVLLNRKHYSFFYTLSAIINLSLITLLRSFPSGKSFVWGMKGIWKGLITR